VAPDGLEDGPWTQALLDLDAALGLACEGLATVSELAPDFVRLHERASMLAEQSLAFTKSCAAGAVRWLDVGVQLRLVESPLDIAATVRKRLLGEGVQASDNEVVEMERRQRSYIFTSATLGDDDKLSWFTQPCGLENAQVLQASSPFDYATQATVYVPRHLPPPKDAGHTLAVADLTANAVRRLGGRTLVLTTTLRALKAIGDDLTESLDGSGIVVLVQGSAPKRELVERFRDGATPGKPGCVLVASASFWEGIDVPGDALQLVIIDKLPFPPPGDPLVEARAQKLEAEGRSPFNDYFIPEAAVALKQGAGRLIRRETDCGILVVCDVRLAQMGYGRRLLAALPPMRRVFTQEEFEGALEALR
jgi:ATP-dependent DNA helicase DinG